MSFGFSVGDFITVIETAKKVWKNFAGAPEIYQGASSVARSAWIVLNDAEHSVGERELTTEQEARVADILKGCQKNLDDLNRTLMKYRELDTEATGLRRKVKRAWKQLLVEPADIASLRSRITENIGLLTAFLAQRLGDDVTRIRRLAESREDQEVLNWLSAADYSQQQAEYIGQREDGTGQWLLEEPKFTYWRDNIAQTLCCQGIPGAGKTIMTSVVVDELTRRFGQNSSSVVAYLYCNFKRQTEQTSAHLLSNLLKQICQGRPSLPESVTSLYTRCKEEKAVPSIDEIRTVIQTVVTGYTNAFVVVDALDECRRDNNCRSKLLSSLFELQAKCKINLLVTTRKLPEITEEFATSPILDIRASEQDVRRYIASHVSELPKFVQKDADLQQSISSAIVKAVDGMFLLAKLHVDSLKGKRSAKAIEVALGRLPTGSEAYDKAYTEAISRIEGQLPDQVTLAKDALTWVTCAKRPLSQLELQHALAVEVDQSEFDENNVPDLDDIISVCTGLLTVQEGSDVVQLVHYTAQEYLDRTIACGKWLREAEWNITAVCATYLSYSIFAAGPCQSDTSFEERMQENPLYRYAAKYWGLHACKCQRLHPIGAAFLQLTNQLDSATQAIFASKYYSVDRGFSQRFPHQATGLHMAAYFGIVGEEVEMFARNGNEVRDSLGHTPLSRAAAGGHKAVVKLLLDTGKAEVDARDVEYSQTPLSRAAAEGHEAVVKLLLDTGKAEVDARDEYGRTPLGRAAAEGHEAVRRLMLDLL